MMTLTLKQRLMTIALSSLLALVSASPVLAADFSQGEITQVHQFQKNYADLDKTRYDRNSLYEKSPVFATDFSAGKLKPKYIEAQLAYINYYRSLFGLTPVTATEIANENAQQTAAVMAAINANPFINQHGLPNETKPNYLSSSMWKLAQDTSETSNLNFNVNNESAGDVITDLLTDRYNLTGSDTGHRAWILSTRLTTTGIGAAYGTNGYRYSVQKVLNIKDLFNEPSQPLICYPAAGLFPIELGKGKNIAWSLYLSNKVYLGKPKITITDLDTGKNYQATDVTNYSSSGYGNFKTIITYSPGKTPLIEGHEYHVQIKDLYSYRFKFFRQETVSSRQENQEKAQTYQTASPQKNANQESAFSTQSAKLWAMFNPKNQSRKVFNYFDALKKGQWKQNFFIHNFLKDLHL